MGKNWNSPTGTYTDIVNDDTKAKATRAKRMKDKGLSVKDIAAKLKLSTSRIYEYLK